MLSTRDYMKNSWNWGFGWILNVNKHDYIPTTTCRYRATYERALSKQVINYLRLILPKIYKSLNYYEYWDELCLHNIRENIFFLFQEYLLIWLISLAVLFFIIIQLTINVNVYLIVCGIALKEVPLTPGSEA